MQYAFGAIIVLAAVGILFIVLRRLPEYGGKNERTEVKEALTASPSLVLSAGFFSISRFIRSIKIPSLSGMHPSEYEGQKPSTSAMKHVSLDAIRSDERGESFWIGLIESDPNNPYLYKKLGEFYMTQGKRQFARETFQYALKLSPDDESIKERLKEV